MNLNYRNSKVVTITLKAKNLEHLDELFREFLEREHITDFNRLLDMKSYNVGNKIHGKVTYLKEIK